jgi:hypothetical protein
MLGSFGSVYILLYKAYCEDQGDSNCGDTTVGYEWVENRRYSDRLLEASCI